MKYLRPFGQVGETVNGDAATSVVAVTRSGMGTQSVRIVFVPTGGGTVPVFVEFGKDASVVATAAKSMPVVPNVPQVFLLPHDITHIAATGAVGTVYYTTGESWS